jgi:1,4-alpha-glucan branching enzyme
MSKMVSRFVIVLLFVGLLACAQTMKPDVPKPVSGGVRFTLLAPEATEVFVMGSFNNWSKGATPMKAIDRNGFWSVEVPLSEGEYTFIYLVNGTRWVTPPMAEDFVTDGFGQTNGVLVVR